jgi:hypothetical protein
MMAPTHLATSMALALPLVAVAPEVAPVAAVAAAAGGVAPDLDLLVGRHRRTLHLPVLAWPPAVVAGALALAAPSATTVAAAFALLAVAVHSAGDALGAGEELRPWERTTPNAVYDHLRRRWLRARYVVRYDGAPEDLALAVAAAVPVALAFDGPPRWLAAAAVAVAVPYAALRKRLPRYFAALE